MPDFWKPAHTGAASLGAETWMTIVIFLLRTLSLSNVLRTGGQYLLVMRTWSLKGLTLQAKLWL